MTPPHAGQSVHRTGSTASHDRRSDPCVTVAVLGLIRDDSGRGAALRHCGTRPQPTATGRTDTTPTAAQANDLPASHQPGR